MPHQPELTSHPLPASPAPQAGAELASGPPAPPAAPQQSQHAQRIPPWLERAELFLRVLLRIWIGVVICFVPWIEACWDRNPLLIDFPSLYFFLTQGAVRGLVSGLGLLNLWIAFQDAVRHGTDKP